tara:strand:+ start:22 stop:675 length:654 start_codon:yes stop_codon:yes gene_type:complete
MYTPFWYNQPNILIDKNSLFEIFPVKEYDTVRKLNAVLRFSIYYTIIVFLYNRSTNIFAVPVVTALITYFIWSKNSSIQINNLDTQLRNDDPNLISLQDHNIGCTLPNKHNPFMNTPFFDVAADKELPQSCTSYDNKGIQRKIEKEFDKGLYRNYTDIFGKENSQRQFFTVPGRQGIPDQSSFAHWLYRTPDTCKEGNSLACLSVGDGNGGGQGIPA